MIDGRAKAKSDSVSIRLLPLNVKDEKNKAKELAEKKIIVIQKSEKDTYKISGKLYRYLRSKGYSYYIVKDVVKDVMSIDDFE